MPENGPRTPVVFPLRPFADGKCSCGLENCPQIGKHPAVLWRELSYGDAVQRPAPGAGVGLKTGALPKGSGVIVVDLDGDDAFAAWEELDLGRSPETYTVATASGVHLYFEHPGFYVKNSRSKLAPHVDIRGDGGMVVAPGSPHRSGVTYDVLVDAPVAQAPAWLLEWLAAQPATVETQTFEGDVADPEELEYRRELYRDVLATAPPAVAGKGGDEQLFEVVQRGAFDLSLPVDDVLELVAEVYNPRCLPPWEEDSLEERVRHKAKDAKTVSTRAQLSPLPRELAGLAPQPWEIEDEEPAAPAPPPVVPATVADDDPELAKFEQELKLTWGAWDEELPPPRYIVQPIIPDDTVGMIVAKGSSLKTWMALSLGIAVANGQPWLGRFMVEQTNVLIVDFESGVWQLRERARILGRLRSPGLGHAAFPAGRADDPAFWRKLALICRARKVGLVIVDSFAASATGVEENDPKAALPLTLAAGFTEVIPSAVIFIHHAKKGEGGDERDLVRGSGAIYAALDWAVTLIPNDENRTRMTVRNIKPWGERPEDFKIALVKDVGLILDSDEAQAAPAAQTEKAKAEIIGVLARGPVATKDLLAKMLGKRRGDVLPYLEALEVSGEVVRMPKLGYCLDDAVKRKARILETVRGNICGTVERIRKLALVEADEVNRLIASGTLVRSAGERYIVLE